MNTQTAKKDNSNSEMLNFYSRYVNKETQRLQRYKIWITYLMLGSCRYNISEIASCVELTLKKIYKIKLLISNLKAIDRLLLQRYGKYAKDVLDNLRSEVF
ncbi:MAG: hypothetical protein FH751_02515 [Firmicutes bacterium]|nr:hypothetical protein [Bacillota bacterium]